MLDPLKFPKMIKHLPKEKSGKGMGCVIYCRTCLMIAVSLIFLLRMCTAIVDCFVVSASVIRIIYYFFLSFFFRNSGLQSFRYGTSESAS